jgi:putative transposase
LDRQFEVDAPDKVWGEPWSAIGPRTMASDITHIKIHEGWLHLAVVMDLFSRRVVGWSVQPRMTTDLALQALLTTVWRRKLKTRVMIPFRPGIAVHQRRVPAVPRLAQSGHQHEPTR